MPRRRKQVRREPERRWYHYVPGLLSSGASAVAGYYAGPLAGYATNAVLKQVLPEGATLMDALKDYAWYAQNYRPEVSPPRYYPRTASIPDIEDLSEYHWVPSEPEPWRDLPLYIPFLNDPD